MNAESVYLFAGFESVIKHSFSDPDPKWIKSNLKLIGEAGSESEQH